MKLKKILPPLLMLALMASFLIYYYYPHDLEDLVGSLPETTQETRMEIWRSESLLEPAEMLTTKKGSRASDLLDFLNQYQYKRTSTNFSALDGELMYNIKFFEGDKETFRMVIRGEEHVSLFNKQGRWTLYKTTEPLDLSVIQSF